MKNHSLRINFVSHLNPFHYSGGGEQYTYRIIREGTARGHEIRVVSMQPHALKDKLNVEQFKDPDLWILFDVFNHE